MNTKSSTGTAGRRYLAVFLSLCMLLPSAALADGKNGKKNFKEGVKYEQQQQWDMAAQNDYASAYTAYRTAYNFDQGNEIARFKMERMLELQKAQAGGTIDQISY